MLKTQPRTQALAKGSPWLQAIVGSLENEQNDSGPSRDPVVRWEDIPLFSRTLPVHVSEHTQSVWIGKDKTSGKGWENQGKDWEALCLFSEDIFVAHTV